MAAVPARLVVKFLIIILVLLAITSISASTAAVLLATQGTDGSVDGLLDDGFLAADLMVVARLALANFITELGVELLENTLGVTELLDDIVDITALFDAARDIVQSVKSMMVAGRDVLCPADDLIRLTVL